MLFQINPSFTKKNQLKLDLSKNILDKNFKLCFSLIYTIQSIDGAKIIKQIGKGGFALVSSGTWTHGG